jgi:hypothetical protein
MSLSEGDPLVVISNFSLIVMEIYEKVESDPLIHNVDLQQDVVALMRKKLVEIRRRRIPRPKKGDERLEHARDRLLRVENSRYPVLKDIAGRLLEVIGV